MVVTIINRFERVFFFSGFGYPYIVVRKITIIIAIKITQQYYYYNNSTRLIIAEMYILLLHEAYTTLRCRAHTSGEELLRCVLHYIQIDTV